MKKINKNFSTLIIKYMHKILKNIFFFKILKNLKNAE
jgi:hypothetical protein